MKPIYKSLALDAMTLQVSLALSAQTYDGETTSKIDVPAEVLESLRVELVALNVSGARNLIESGECVVDGSNLTITLDTSEWTCGAMYRVQVLATFGTQTQVIYALNVTVPYYVALSDTPQEYEDTVTVVLTITDVTEADLDGLALEETSQEIKAAITPISQAAEAYNVGKTQLAAAITSKGVETSPTESYPEMAEKVNAIMQETYEINGGEMYAKQLFGSLVAPNYWNLYDVLAQLLSDGRLVNYGGILLAEYYRGYDSLALSGAGAGGAYVVSDKDSDDNFIMYTNDTTHVWATEFDGKGNRWVAYCFADEYHDFDITDTNTSPRSIFIGRKVGTITSLVAGRVSQIVVPDGNELLNFTGKFAQNFGKSVVIRNIKEQSGYLIYDQQNVETVYVQADTISGNIIGYGSVSASLETLRAVIVDCANIHGYLIDTPYTIANTSQLSLLVIKNCMNGGLSLGVYQRCSLSLLKEIIVEDSEEFICGWRPSGLGGVADNIRIYFGYKTNDKTKTFNLTYEATNPWQKVAIIELKNGWCKPLNVSNCVNLTESVMFTYILQRLKQDEPDCGDGVTITLGSTNLAKLTSDESVQLLDDLTNIYGYTFA